MSNEASPSHRKETFSNPFGSFTMPAIASGKVLITGSNGYIASWTVKSFLDAGFSVRGTVRDERKAAHLKKVLSSYGDRLEFAVVPDMAKVRPGPLPLELPAHGLDPSPVQDGAFDTAAAGVDAIVHTCSPTNLNAVEPEEMIARAREGLLAALRAAARSPSVRRVVFTSSCATVVDPHATGPRVYDEECWNEGDIAEVESKGREASAVSKYRASKIVAEHAAWKFFEDAKAEAAARNEECRWDLVVLNPPWVFGPVLHEVHGGPETLNASNVFWHSAVMKEKPLGFP